MKSEFFLKRIVELFSQNRLVQAISVSCDSSQQRLLMAKNLSQNLFCQNLAGVNACLQCPSCQKIEHGNYPDVYIYQPEKNEIPLDDIKNMLRWLNISPHEQNKKVLHIHNAHRLNASSSNALLKSMEEPPTFAHIILWTENQNRLLRTILSRSLKCHIQDEALNAKNPVEPPAWSNELNELLQQKNHTALEKIFNFSKSIAKQKEEHHFFFDQFYKVFLKLYMHEAQKNYFLHLNRMENFHTLLKHAESQVLNRYGNAQLWIERLLIDWKKLWNLAQ
ncbi:MAG TPA: hypothetical protein PKC21_03590 [Oligoflexia bacterium]|nr:hypothetical protein [Oligoflexia bacterium]HMR24419.1 hypothetical protein [Oligoflexia bacterium]